MAKFYVLNDGTIARFVRTYDQEAQYGAPDNTVYTVDFDPDTNANLVNGYNSNCNAYSAPNGVLQQNGQPVAIAAPSGDYTLRQKLTQVSSALKGGQYKGATVTLTRANACWTAVQAGTASLDQVQELTVFFGNCIGYELAKLLATFAI